MYFRSTSHFLYSVNNIYTRSRTIVLLDQVRTFHWLLEKPLSSETTKCSTKFIEKYTPLEKIGAIKIFKDLESTDVEQNSDVILGNGHIMLSAFDASDVSITYQARIWNLKWIKLKFQLRNPE